MTHNGYSYHSEKFLVRKLRLFVGHSSENGRRLPVYVPFLASISMGLTIFSAFLYYPIVLGLAMIMKFVVVLLVLGGHSGFMVRHSFGFWVFVLTEFMLFLGLLMVYLGNTSFVNHDWWGSVGNAYFQTLVLFCSAISLSCATYYYGYGVTDAYWKYTIYLGVFFMFLSLKEFSTSVTKLLGPSDVSLAISVLFLHFFHVCAGSLLLDLSRLFSKSDFDGYYFKLMVGYWHFVEVVWLVVIFMIYWA